MSGTKATGSTTKATDTKTTPDATDTPKRGPGRPRGSGNRAPSAELNPKLAAMQSAASASLALVSLVSDLGYETANELVTILESPAGSSFARMYADATPRQLSAIRRVAEQLGDVVADGAAFDAVVQSARSMTDTIKAAQ